MTNQLISFFLLGLVSDSAQENICRSKVTHTHTHTHTHTPRTDVLCLLCPHTAGTPETYGNLLVWDAIMPRMKATFEDMQREQDLYR